jgi:hypothetical protein
MSPQTSLIASMSHLRSHIARSTVSYDFSGLELFMQCLNSLDANNNSGSQAGVNNKFQVIAEKMRTQWDIIKAAYREDAIARVELLQRVYLYIYQLERYQNLSYKNNKLRSSGRKLSEMDRQINDLFVSIQNSEKTLIGEAGQLTDITQEVSSFCSTFSLFLILVGK